MKFEDLIGLHQLSGVDESSEIIHSVWGGVDESVGVILFIIDGITYKAVENPDDGYRSYCKGLEITEDKISNTFPPQSVLGKMKEEDDYGKHDIIEFVDVVTGKVVLEVGTADTDDYYPCCVMYWKPENLAINQNK